jgi:exo-1,4-beta-D-glucosaminidase
MTLEKRGVAVTRLLLLSLLSFVSASQAEELVLKDGWSIQSSREVSDKGSVLSTSAFHPKQWYRTTMPSTVVAALVADHVYADPYFGMNLRSLPGTTYTVGTTFASIAMPPER